MIIYGWRTLWRTIHRLVFQCPGCGAERNGVRKKGRRWFTLFWIPVIPLTDQGEIVECDTCRTMYRADAVRVSGAHGGAAGPAIPARVISPVTGMTPGAVPTAAPGYGAPTAYPPPTTAPPSGAPDAAYPPPGIHHPMPDAPAAYAPAAPPAPTPVAPAPTTGGLKGSLSKPKPPTGPGAPPPR